MQYPYMQYPLEESIEEFLDGIENKFLCGNMTIKEYHICLGKALAYTEAQFTSDRISKERAYELIHKIEDMAL